MSSRAWSAMSPLTLIWLKNGSPLVSFWIWKIGENSHVWKIGLFRHYNNVVFLWESCDRRGVGVLFRCRIHELTLPVVSSDSFTDIFRHFSVILLVDYFIVVEENGLKDSDICLDLTSSFLSWLLSKFPLRRLSFRFDVVTIHQNFVTSSKALKKVWVVRGVSKQLFSEGCEMLFLLTIYSKIVPCARL